MKTKNGVIRGAFLDSAANEGAAIAVPSAHILTAYSCFLYNERRRLFHEVWPGVNPDEIVFFDGTADALVWGPDAALPQSRANAVLAAAGVRGPLRG